MHGPCRQLKELHRQRRRSEPPAREVPAAMWRAPPRAQHGPEPALPDGLLQHGCEAGLPLPRLLPEEEAVLPESQVGGRGPWRSGHRELALGWFGVTWTLHRQECLWGDSPCLGLLQSLAK